MIKLMFEFKGTLDIASEGTGNFLEMKVHPFSKAMKQTARIGYNRTGFKRSLVDLHEEIKIGKRISNCSFVVNERLEVGR